MKSAPTPALWAVSSAVLSQVFPDQAALFAKVMEDRYGFTLADDGSTEVAIGVDAAIDLLVPRLTDGANQPNAYDSTGIYTPFNPDPTVRIPREGGRLRYVVEQGGQEQCDLGLHVVDAVPRGPAAVSSPRTSSEASVNKAPSSASSAFIA